MPFQGSGGEDTAPQDPTPVYVSAVLDRLLQVDDQNYEFTASIMFYLSWRDPRVRGHIAENAAKMQAKDTDFKCEVPCQSNNNIDAGGCCDGVWMPYIAFTNIKALSQDRVVRWGLGFSKEGDGVFQWSSVLATYSTPLDMRAFPFDTQRLLVQMSVPQERHGWSGGLLELRPGTTGTHLFTARPAGDDLPGWSVADVRLDRITYPLCQAALLSALRPSPADEPMPLVPGYLWTSRAAQKHAHQCAAELTSQPASVRLQSPYWRTSINQTGVPQEPVMVEALNVLIIVERFSSRWVLSAIFPILATTWLGCLVFLLPRDDMGGRLGSIVALFLALAAIQFVVDSNTPSASFLTPLQQLTLASYICLILTGLESVVIWRLTTYHVEKHRGEQHQLAQQRLDAKIAAMQEALDAWLSKTKNDYRSEQTGLGDRPAAAPLAAAASQTRRQRAFKIIMQKSAPNLLALRGFSSRQNTQGSQRTSQDGGALSAPSGVATLSTWWQRGRIFLEHVAADEAFADRAGHLTNKWAAIAQLVGYNLGAVLIFGVNTALYGR
ncbi:hypothetical protein OEZ86_014240 [Tetradesmus obliquus]|nr:hypothetical protein OEZ86_014240 [Tetradesmus obliquus]